jgi:hypothetical protein
MSSGISKVFRETAVMKRTGARSASVNHTRMCYTKPSRSVKVTISVVVQVARNRLQRDFQREVAAFHALSKEIVSRERMSAERPSFGSVDE